VSTRSRPTQPLGVDGPFAAFAGELLGRELPDLDDARRTATVDFVCRRVRALPTPLLLGLTLLVLAMGVARTLAGPERVTGFLCSTRLPLVGELARLVRSLGFAFVWETWPDTSPTGAVAVPT
jgi:hypothetical protein